MYHEIFDMITIIIIIKLFITAYTTRVVSRQMRLKILQDPL